MEQRTKDRLIGAGIFSIVAGVAILRVLTTGGLFGDESPGTRATRFDTGLIIPGIISLIAALPIGAFFGEKILTDSSGRSWISSLVTGACVSLLVPFVGIFVWTFGTITFGSIMLMLNNSFNNYYSSAPGSLMAPIFLSLMGTGIVAPTALPFGIMGGTLLKLIRHARDRRHPTVGD